MSLYPPHIEDHLVSMVLEDGYGECEAWHERSVVGHMGPPPCSGDVVALVNNCGHPDHLVCSAVAEYTAWVLRRNYARCSTCRRRVRDCWSVVMLP